MTKSITKKQHVAAIRNIYWDLFRIMDGNHYLDGFVSQISQDERTHRKCRPSSITKSFGLTVSEATQYFTCKWILEGKSKKPDVKNYLHMKKEVFTGYAIYHKYIKEIKEQKVFTKKTIEMINSFDYAEYI